MTDVFVFFEVLFFSAADGAMWFTERVFCCFWAKYMCSSCIQTA